jgi:hypothetical protein
MSSAASLMARPFSLADGGRWFFSGHSFGIMCIICPPLQLDRIFCVMFRVGLTTSRFYDCPDLPKGEGACGRTGFMMCS